MAIVGINPVNVRAQPSEKEKRRPIDDILEGLSLVQGITGIGVNLIKAKEGLELSEQRAAAAQRSKTQFETGERIAGGDFISETEAAQQGFFPAPEGIDPSLTTRIAGEERGIVSGGQLQSREKANIAAKAEEDIRQIRLDFDKDKDFRNFMQARQTDFNKQTEKIDKSANQVNDIEKLITSGNPVAFEFAKNQLVKLSGDVGAITQADREVFGGSPDVLARIDRFFKKSATGEVTVQDRQLIQEILDIYKKKIPDQINRIANRFADQIRRTAKITGQELTNEQIISEFLVPKGAAVPFRQQGQPTGGGATGGVQPAGASGAKAPAPGQRLQKIREAKQRKLQQPSR